MDNYENIKDLKMLKATARGGIKVSVKLKLELGHPDFGHHDSKKISTNFFSASLQSTYMHTSEDPLQKINPEKYIKM